MAGMRKLLCGIGRWRERQFRAVRNAYTSNGSRFKWPHQTPFWFSVDRSASLDSYL